MWVILAKALVEKTGTLRTTEPVVRKVLVKGLKSLSLNDLCSRDLEDQESRDNRIVDKVLDQGTAMLTDEDLKVTNLPEIGKIGYLDLEVFVISLDTVPRAKKARRAAWLKAQEIGPVIAGCFMTFNQEHSPYKLHRLILELAWLTNRKLPRRAKNR